MKKRSLGIVSLAALALGAGAFVQWSNQPAVTRPATQPNVMGVSTPTYKTKPYRNTYFAAELPSRFQERTTDAGNGQSVLLQQLWSAPPGSNLFADQLAITVGAMPAGGIEDVAAVQMRRRSPDYTTVNASWLPLDKGVVFERNSQGYELGVFLKQGTRYAAIVLTGLADKKPELSHEMQQVTDSVAWQ